jgi:hypothetical protein
VAKVPPSLAVKGIEELASLPPKKEKKTLGRSKN